jgi:hypothetical protein
MELDLYVALQDNACNQHTVIHNMAFASSVVLLSGSFIPAVSPVQIVRGVMGMCAVAGFVTVFRPLLVGIARALALAVRPRPARARLAAPR